MRINKKEFNQWLIALYEQQYPKTVRRLQNKNGYCCLGVACEILIPEKKKQKGEYLKGFLPKNQRYAPVWLKDLDNDFKHKSSFFLSELNDTGLSGFSKLRYQPFTHPEIAMLLDLVYNYKILD